LLVSSDQEWEVHSIYTLSTHPPWTLDLGNPCQDDEQLHNHHNIRHTSREYWNLEAREWEVHSIYILSTHLPWILDLGNPCQGDEYLHNRHITVIPAGSAGIQGPGMGEYTTSTLSALTFHGFWISAIPAKMTCKSSA